MSATFTPGPWVAVEADETTPLSGGMLMAVHAVAEPWKAVGAICDVIAQGKGQYDREMTNANALVIAAAPDLFYVATNHLNNCAACEDESCNLCRSAVAAIAKAKGR